FRGRGVKKGPANPISLVSADLRWQRGQPPMPHPTSHAGPVPAPAVPCPAGTGEQQSVTALSGPGLGVPVSIWPHTPVPGRGSGPDTAQIITAFSRPGELVVIPGARDGALLAAAAAAGRRVLGLAPGPRSRQRVLADPGGLEPRLRPPAAGRPGRPRDGPGGVIPPARAAGLVYAQHIVALHAAITGGQLTPGPPGAARPDEVAGPAAVHACVHSDLLVFTKPGGISR